ncbi:MAG: lytic transglycosylase domain-containing protein [Candidatus Woesearchaeota archaeon]
MKKAASTETIMWQIINLVLAIIFIVIPMLGLIRPIIQSNFSETKYYLKTYQIAVETLFSYEFLDNWILPKKGNEVVINPREKELQIDKVTTFLTIPSSDLPEINYKSSDRVLIKRDYLSRYHSSVDFKVSDKFCIDFDRNVNSDTKNAVIGNFSHVVGIYFSASECTGLNDVVINVTNNEIKCYYENDLNCQELIYEVLGSSGSNSISYSTQDELFLNLIKLYTLMNNQKGIISTLDVPLFFYDGDTIKFSFKSNKICKDQQWTIKCEESTPIENNNFVFSESLYCSKNVEVSFTANCFVSFKNSKLEEKEQKLGTIIQNIKLDEEQIERYWTIVSNYESKEVKLDGFDDSSVVSNSFVYQENFNSKNINFHTVDENKFNNLIKSIKGSSFEVTLPNGVKVRRNFDCGSDCEKIANAILVNYRSYQINPLLFLALIIAESGGNAKAVSDSGCIGLGQISPLFGRGKVAIDMYQKLKGVSVSAEQALKDIDVNVNLSMMILKGYYKEVIYPFSNDNEKRKCECNINGKLYVVGPISYSGWQAALRRYNGLGCRCDFGHLFYVEIITGIYDELVKKYNNVR